jgi:uncharacterized RDD family membrane protein YckC
MSDFSQGPGWWQASDGKWYPPEQAPGAQATAAPTAPPGYGGAPGAPPAYGAPAYGAPAYGGAPMAAGPGQLAEWPQRVLGFLADLLCLLPLIILQVVFTQISTALGLLMNLVVLVASLYFAYLNGERGQSPGKALVGLKTVKETTGQTIGGVNGIIRNIAHIADSIICGIGYLLPLFDAKKQTLADKIMGTVVLSGQEKKSFGPELFK